MKKKQATSEVTDVYTEDILVTNEKGIQQKVPVELEKKKLVDTDGKESTLVKNRGENVNKPLVKQSDLIFVKNSEVDHMDITGTPVEVLEDKAIFIAEALDYFFTCKIRHAKLLLMALENPENCPKASEVTFIEYLAACVKYSTDQLHKDVPDIRNRVELQRYISNGDMQGYEEQVSLLKMIVENTVIAYENFLSMDTLNQKSLVEDAYTLWYEREGEKLEMEEITRRLKSGENIDDLMDKY